MKKANHNFSISILKKEYDIQSIFYKTDKRHRPGEYFVMSENKTYSEKLKDPRWQKKRLEILNRYKWLGDKKCLVLMGVNEGLIQDTIIIGDTEIEAFSKMFQGVING